MAQASPVRTRARVGRIAKPGATWIRSRGARLVSAAVLLHPAAEQAADLSNCYLHPFDLFVKRELGCRAYLRYVDDFALFSDDRATLWAHKEAIRNRLAGLRQTLHEQSAQVAPTADGIPWLGFVVFPDHCLIKARKVRYATHRIGERYAAYRAGALSFAEFDASVRGWINHARHADSWGLRRHLLEPLVLKAGDVPGRRPPALGGAPIRRRR